MISIQFVGTGGAFDVAQGNSAAWITFKGKNILLDCGHSVYPRLREKGLADKMDYILLTHLHDDHAGSLSTLIFHQTHVAQRRSSVLYPTADFGDHLFAYLAFSQQQPDAHSDFIPLWQFPGRGISYLETTGMHVPGMMTFAYIFEDDDEILIYSGDMGNPDLILNYLDANPSPKKIRIFHELIFYPGIRAHCYYRALEPLAEKYSVYGYHINPETEPKDNKIPLVANFPELLL